jgi:RNA polymerase sigma factor (sigma-70 family)
MDPLLSYFRQMRRILLRRGQTPEAAEDLIQEAFLRMQEYCQRGGKVQKPEGFLVRTVLRLAMNARRDEHRELYTVQKPEEFELILDTSPKPDEVFAAEECLERMRVALDAVSRRTRDILFLHRLDGLSYAQIAEQTGLSISAIEKHVASALVTLAKANITD